MHALRHFQRVRVGLRHNPHAHVDDAITFKGRVFVFRPNKHIRNIFEVDGSTITGTFHHQILKIFSRLITTRGTHRHHGRIVANLTSGTFEVLFVECIRNIAGRNAAPRHQFWLDAYIHHFIEAARDIHRTHTGDQAKPIEQHPLDVIGQLSAIHF
ncbi:Uncharacterised protein [Vibrio cholerae]|uniref:Uncharacterized protein n=1 Tax=Vibrio cholerae TaxID=666 RepID=A0A655ZI95_VIBCL|nr:Uncharacterised protein [Vibrio cholerae]